MKKLEIRLTDKPEYKKGHFFSLTVLAALERTFLDKRSQQLEELNYTQFKNIIKAAISIHINVGQNGEIKNDYIEEVIDDRLAILRSSINSNMDGSEKELCLGYLNRIQYLNDFHEYETIIENDSIISERKDRVPYGFKKFLRNEDYLSKKQFDKIIENLDIVYDVSDLKPIIQDKRAREMAVVIFALLTEKSKSGQKLCVLNERETVNYSEIYRFINCHYELNVGRKMLSTYLKNDRVEKEIYNEVINEIRTVLRFNIK